MHPEFFSLTSYRRRVLGAMVVLLVSISALTFTCRASKRSGAVRLQGPSGTVPASFFGLHIHNAAVSPAYWPPFPVFGWRLWDPDIAWSHLEPQQGNWNFAALDKYVDLAEQHHAEILLELGQTPTWAASRPEELSAYNERGGASEPKNFDTWREYVRKVATRYKGRIHVYEIWNEANEHSFYSGTVEQMVALAKDAYTILKEVDPSNTVVSPSGMGLGSNIQWLDDFFSKGGGKYCDVISYHFYVTPKAPESMLEVIGKVREVVERHHLNKPLWDTETGWDKQKTFANNDESVGYLVRAYLLTWASGWERLYWYSYNNYNWASLSLTLPDYRTLTAAGKAYQALQSWLVGSQVQSCSRETNDSWSCEIRRRDGSSAWILWSTGTQRNTLPIKCCHDARIHHLDGRTETKDVEGGVQVGQSPILLEKASHESESKLRKPTYVP